MTRFELATFRSRTERSTKLSHAPAGHSLVYQSFRELSKGISDLAGNKFTEFFVAVGCGLDRIALLSSATTGNQVVAVFTAFGCLLLVWLLLRFAELKRRDGALEGRS